MNGIVIDPMASNTRARRFYERLGFRFIEHRRFDQDDCAVYRLDRHGWHPADTGSRIIATPRLRLRPWRPEDLVPFAAINADPCVARYLPSTLSRSESDALAKRAQTGLERDGFGLWATERVDHPAHPFVGFIGLSVPTASGRPPLATTRPLPSCGARGGSSIRQTWHRQTTGGDDGDQPDGVEAFVAAGFG